VSPPVFHLGLAFPAPAAIRCIRVFCVSRHGPESPNAYSARLQWCRAECVRRECLLSFAQLLFLRFPGGVQICVFRGYIRAINPVRLHVQLQSSGTPRVFYYSSSFISVCVCVLCSHPFVPKQTTLRSTGRPTKVCFKNEKSRKIPLFLSVPVGIFVKPKRHYENYHNQNLNPIKNNSERRIFRTAHTYLYFKLFS
jgi:hypothetical protein